MVLTFPADFLVTHEEPHHAFELRDSAIANVVRLFMR